MVWYTHKGEALRITGASLNQKFIPPAIQRLETLRVVYIVDQHTAVGASVECDAQGLEPFLTGGIPNLRKNQSVMGPKSCLH